MLRRKLQSNIGVYAMKSLRFCLLCLACLSLFVSAACSGDGGGPSPSAPVVASSNDDGILSLSLTDATTDEFKAIYITVNRVDVFVPDECRR